jgi:hypothetical protein
VDREGIAMGARAARVGWRGAWTVGVLLGLAGFGIAARADEPRAAAAWVAPDALAYLEILRPEALLDRATGPKVRELIAAVPGLDEQLKGKQLQELRAVANLLASQLGVELDEAVRDLAADGLAVAVEGKEKVERIVLIVTPRKPELLARAHERLLAMARGDAKSKGKPDPVAESDHRGVTTYSVSPQEAHAIVRDRLVIANGPEALRAVLDRIESGGPDSLASDSNFRARREAAPSDALAFAFARPARLRAIDPKSYGGETPDAGATFILGAWYDSLRNAEWASATLTWTDSRLAADLFLPPPASGYSDAFARYRPPSGQGAAPTIHVPGSILTVSLWRDLSAIWEVRQDIFPPEAQQNLAQLDTLAGTFFGGRDFGTGVLGSIGHDWRLVIANQDYAAMSPSPDTKLPGFALIVGLKPGDDEFSDRLKAAFQSFIGLVNLGAAQEKAPPLMLGMERVGDVTIATSKYLAPKPPADGEPDEPVDGRYNFSFSSAQVGDTFFLASNVELARELVRALQSGAPGPGGGDSTLVAEADGDALAALVEVNRERLAMNNMLEKGNARPAAEAQIDLLARLLRYLHRGRLSVADRPDGAHLTVEFDLSAD